MEKNIFGCFLLGVSVGVGIGMLVAPQTGEQMRGRVKAKADEGTIRREFGLSVGENATHGSDSDENAAIEIAYFFSKLEIT